MTPRQRILAQGVLRSGVSMPVFAIHSRETSPVPVNVEALIEQMERAEELADAKKPRPIVNRAR